MPRGPERDAVRRIRLLVIGREQTIDVDQVGLLGERARAGVDAHLGMRSSVTSRTLPHSRGTKRARLETFPIRMERFAIAVASGELRP